ncbi:allophanate hydrolase [Camelimonas fluminis]|uniref:Allophanate hydrolase n=1 Tax=Camelimonas fluminis TaxID=1576911 RepID=A0ABV7UFY2_9HYPH|nr:allophanate hydrolase [Camelimonas fluminis]GHE62237.1 allophanate hydrolase [Camelimonas fluminis]
MPADLNDLSLANLPFADLSSRVAAYRAGRDPMADLRATHAAISAATGSHAWISVMPLAMIEATLAAASRRLEAGEDLPLYGAPFAVKDNIDVAGLPTTAACPAFAFTPTTSATAVDRLVAAGAIPVGKTNLDQFATGLSGARSPYGVPASALDPTLVSGGSSSGSAIAVATGLAPFALGTDTAGSGRVPAAFNNVVGLKPTRGLISAIGVTPACRSLDCVSVFAATVADALLVTRIAAGFDAADPYSRRAPADALATPAVAPFRFGVLDAATLALCDAVVQAAYLRSISRLEAIGGTAVAIDWTPMRQAAALLYDGPWIAERLAAVGDFLGENPDRVHPAVGGVIAQGKNWSAVDAFQGQYRLAALARQAEAIWDAVDIVLTPTAPEHPSIDAMLADPIGRNARLGLFTNFVNLMDLAALAVPSDLTYAGLPTGVTLVGPAFSDGRLAVIGDLLHRATPAASLGATRTALAATAPVAASPRDGVTLAVVGAHLRGEPLNWQLTDRNAEFLGAAKTGAGYSLYALAGTTPPKPGLLRDGGDGGVALELWRLTPEAFGTFVAGIPAPLGVGSVELEDGSVVKGFLCEPHAVAGARDITVFGGWRAFLTAAQAA